MDVEPTEELSVVNGRNEEWRRASAAASSMNELVLHKQLTEAVRDLSDPKDLQKCLVTKLKTVLQCSATESASSVMKTEIKVENPNDVFTNIVEHVLNLAEARGATYANVKKSAVVKELVKTYLQHTTSASSETLQDTDPEPFELKIDNDDNESTTNDSFPPELVPQVDGVDSSAEGKSDDPSKEDGGSSLDGKESSIGTNADTRMTGANAQNELTENNDDDESHSDVNNAATNSVSNHKSKILSEMENKFAKETQNALKNRPTYKKRNKSESWEFNINGKSESESESAIDSAPSPRKLILMKEPGELELASVAQIRPDHGSEVVDMDDNSATNDENNPIQAPNAGSNQIASIGSGGTSSSSSSSLKALRKFRKGTRNPSFSSTDSTTNTSDLLPSIHIDHDPQELGPPVITKSNTPPPPRSPVKHHQAMSGSSSTRLV